MKGIRCLNCDHMVYEKFCPNCGQKGDTKRIDWHFLFHDIPHSILHLDKGFLYTAKKLFLNPGAAAREFLDGKRIRHFRPLAYVIILSIVMTLGVKTDGIEPGAAPIDSGMEDEDFQVSGETITYALGKYYAFLVIACIPIYAFIAWLLNRKERNFVEIFTGFLFIFGHTTWFGLGLIIIRLVDNEILENIGAALWLGGIFIYSMWGLISMFTRFPLWRRVVNATLTFVLGFIIAGFTLLLALFYYGQWADQ